MKKHFIVVLVLSLFFSAHAQTNLPMELDADFAVKQLREGLVDSFNQGDIDRLISYLDTNAVVTWQNGEVCEGPAAVKAYYERMMKGDHPVVSKVTADPKILGRHAHGDWAVSWGVLNDDFVLTDGRHLPLNSRFTATIIKRGERWLVSSFHVSVNAFDNPITNLAVKKISIAVGIGGIVVGLFIGVITAGIIVRRKRSHG
ncbi:MAG TPA: nuclear transport factor 2 family protein [Verrucomicrobiae bacterium]|nr:nuclear transport factor 2 family protein [Verrucomicrobiae bacterium]